MKCPRCGKWLGIRRLITAVPGRPFACARCGGLLKTGVRDSTLLALAAIPLAVAPLFFLPNLLRLLWSLAFLPLALYAYARLAKPFDPAEVLAYRGVELLPEGVRYGGEVHAYSAIPHLERFARRTEIHFVSVGEYLRVRVHREGGAQPIVLENKAGLVFSTAGLEELYERLAERTFRYRLRRYLLQLERHGHFEYGGARFHRNGEVEIGPARLDVRTAKISLQPFALVLNPPGLFNRRREIDAETDRDVLLALLEQVYGLRFKSQV